MHAMERCTGDLNIVPDVFDITSLDIIIHRDKKIGEGGCGEVFIADWQGNTVAVKVFKLDKGAHPDVIPRFMKSNLFSQRISLDIPERN